jgi:phosphoglucomutase
MPAPFIDPETGFSYPGPELEPFDYTPTMGDLEEALASTILSASGWRKVFAFDGDQESRSPRLKPADRVLALGMADAFAGFLAEAGKPAPRVAVGIDSRFTGPALADGMIRILLARGAAVDYLGIVAAPEIMAWVQTAGVHDGFVYVSASHNPLGHNGVKFGLGNGGVVGGSAAAELIRRFRASVSAEAARGWCLVAAQASPPAVQAVLAALPARRKAAAQAYAALCDHILTGSADAELRCQRKADLAALVGARGLGVVAELNGSARGLSIDNSWLPTLGVSVRAINATPRQFVHRIVPEGESLDLCRAELEKAHAADPRFELGYVPDCDGDRGNVVFFDTAQGRARILEAQEVFALCVLSELAGLEYYGEGGKAAVVANDPTSFRVDEIASAFGAEVARAEVGEANAVGLARELRAKGRTVRILGEGSNGGNITFPGSVRDPLSTLGSLIKLVSLRSRPGRPGLFELWCRRSGRPELYSADYTLADVVATLPRWTTTGTSEERAMLKITATDHGALKAAVEAAWPQAWESRKAELAQRWGIVSWSEVNYEGTAEKPGFGPAFRSGRQTGGLKIVLKDKAGKAAGCLWMRGSGTEPVFRILAEVRGDDPAGEADLLGWLTTLVRAADQSLQRPSS